MSDPDFATTLIQLRAARSGDGEAWNELFARYAPRVRTIVSVKLGQRGDGSADVDDIVQDVLLKAFAGIERFDERGSDSFRHWIARIALNHVRDLHRYAGRQKRGSGKVRAMRDVYDSTATPLDVPASDPSPSQVVRAHELEGAMHAALQKLGRRQQDVLIDRDFAGKPYEEIAAEMGFRTSEPVRALCARARKKLRTLMRSFDDAAEEP